MATTTPDPRDTGNAQVDLDRYDWHLTRADVDRVCHQLHPCAMGRGLAQAYIARWYPGFGFSDLFGIFRNAGVHLSPDENEYEEVRIERRFLVGRRTIRTPRRAGAPHGGRCHWQMVSLHFNGPDDFHVVWDRSIPKDHGYLAHSSTGPTGRGPDRGVVVEPEPAPRPVDLSGSQIFG